MFFNVKEDKLRVSNTEIDYITFGTGKKNLIMIQALFTIVNYPTKAQRCKSLYSVGKILFDM